MNNNKSIVALFFIFIFSIFIGGCSLERVEPGYLGRIKNPSGFGDNPVLPPGRYWTGFGSDVVRLETSDTIFSQEVRVLCADELNFSFEIEGLASVRTSTPEEIERVSAIFAQLRVNEQMGSSRNTISAQQLMETYVVPRIRDIAYGIVEKYEVREIAGMTSEISNEIREAVMAEYADSFIEIKRVSLRNLAFPEVITNAQETRARRQIEIEENRARQEIARLEATNQLEIAEINYQSQLIEAAMVADYNRIIGSSVTEGFLSWWQLKVLSEAADGPNNWGFIPYTDMIHGRGNSLNLQESVVDAALLERVQNARNNAQMLEVPEE